MSPDGHDVAELSLATDADRIAVAWHGGESGNAIWVRRLDAQARPQGAPLLLSDGRNEAYEPDLQFFGGDYVVAWYEKAPATGALSAWLGRFDAFGNVRWRQALSAPGTGGRNPVVRVHGEELLVAWIQMAGGNDAAIWTARVSAEGELVEAPVRRAGATRETWNLNAAVDAEGTFHVAYDAALGTRAKEIHLLRLSRGAVTAVQLSEDDGHDSTYPDIALSACCVALTWFDERDGNSEVYLFVGTVGQLRPGIHRNAVRITRTPGASIGAYVAWNGSRVGLAWSDDSSGQFEVFSRVFDARGVAQGAQVRHTRTPAHSLIPAIRPWDDGFALAWNEYEAGDGSRSQHARGSGSRGMIAVRPR